VVRASAKPLPARITDQLAAAGPDTNTGDDTVVTLDEFMPSSPAVLSPQAYNKPEVVRASVNDAPAETADQDAPVGPDTNTGDDTAVAVLLLPTCPMVF